MLPQGEQLLKLIVISEVSSAMLDILRCQTGNTCGPHSSRERPLPGEQLHKDMGVLGHGPREGNTSWLLSSPLFEWRLRGAINSLRRIAAARLAGHRRDHAMVGDLNTWTVQM